MPMKDYSNDLSLEWIEAIKPHVLEADRNLQRDVHRSLYNMLHENEELHGVHRGKNRIKPIYLEGDIEHRTEEGFQRVLDIGVEAPFVLNVDPTNFYFFDSAEDVNRGSEILRAEDTIPSGIKYAPLDPRTLEVALEASKEPTYAHLFVDDNAIETTEDLARLFRREVFEAGYLIGKTTPDVPFDKPLRRVFREGGKVETYNPQTKTWQSDGKLTFNPRSYDNARVRSNFMDRFKLAMRVLRMD